MLRHLAEGASWHAVIDLGAVRLENAELTLRTRIPLARCRNILLGMDHHLIVLRIVQVRSQRNARRV